MKKSVGWVEQLPYKEYREWQAYFKINPFGEYRDDLNSAIVASTIANVNRGKHSPPYKPKDFMPKFNKKSKQMTDDEIKAVLRRACGGR